MKTLWQAAQMAKQKGRGGGAGGSEGNNPTLILFKGLNTKGLKIESPKFIQHISITSPRPPPNI